MTATVFNSCLLLGWLLVLVGGVWLNPAVGLVTAGLLLLGLTLYISRLAGVFVPRRKPVAEDD